MIRRGQTAGLVGCLALLLAACDGGAATVAGGSAVPGGRPAITRTLTARDIALQPGELTVPAGVDLVIAFDNADPGVPHGIALYADQAHSVAIGTAPVVVGPDRQTLQIAPLAPGRYRFSCVVHPNMVADLVVQPSS